MGFRSQGSQRHPQTEVAKFEQAELLAWQGVSGKNVRLLRPGSIGYELQVFGIMLAEKTNFTVPRMGRLLQVKFLGWATTPGLADRRRACRHTRWAISHSRKELLQMFTKSGIAHVDEGSPDAARQ